MKKQLLLLSLLSVCFSVAIASSTPLRTNLMPEDPTWNVIVIKGELSEDPVLRSAPYIPIEAEQNSEQVVLHFLGNIGVTTITVKNTQGHTVYQTAVNTMTTHDVFISTMGWSAGTYTLSIKPFYGKGYTGEFEIE